jgi:hypothetical protein
VFSAFKVTALRVVLSRFSKHTVLTISPPLRLRKIPQPSRIVPKLSANNPRVHSLSEIYKFNVKKLILSFANFLGQKLKM